MQTIKIDTALYNKLVDRKKPLLSKEEITKIVENSQRIEGYEAVSKNYELEVEAFMKEHNIEVSA